MTRKASFLLAAFALAFGNGSAIAQTTGDWVLGNYQRAGYWFPGVVEAIRGGKITILYDDGDRETVRPEDVRPYDWMLGTRVECNYLSTGHWYPGTISSLAGEKIGIAYDDGEREITRTGRCRSR